MNIRTECKVIKDAYAGFYSCGLSMLDSATMTRFKETKNTENFLEMQDDRGLVLSVSKNPVRGCTEIITEIKNTSDKSITLEMITSFVIDGIKADRVHRLLSFWSAEGRHKVDSVNDLNLEKSWTELSYRIHKFGNVGSMPVRSYFPFVALEDIKTKRFTAVSLYSPSSWQIEIIKHKTDEITLAGGIADRDFGHFTKKLAPGEILITPKAMLSEGTDFEEVCDKLVKAQNPDVSAVDKTELGFTFNEYCTSWGNPTEESIKKLADALEGKGFKYLVIDCGWFGDSKVDWWDATGDWYICKEKFPNGLKPVCDYIKEKGMIPGIWFELEVAARFCHHYKNASELLIKDEVPLSVGDRRFLDMENKEVIDRLSHEVIETLKDAGFGYIKIDYNDTIGVGVDGPDGRGENLRRKVLATQEFFKKIKREIPEIVIENCSSGGHRLEPSFMELASMASFSDAHEITALPIIAANLHRAIKPSQSQIWAVIRAKDSDERIIYSMAATFLGRLGLSGDIYDISYHQWSLILEAMDFYKKAEAVIKDGFTDTLINTTDSYNNPTGNQLVVRTLNNKKLVIFHRFENSLDLTAFLAKENIDLNISSFEYKYGDARCDFSAEAYIINL